MQVRYIFSKTDLINSAKEFVEEYIINKPEDFSNAKSFFLRFKDDIGRITKKYCIPEFGKMKLFEVELVRFREDHLTENYFLDEWFKEETEVVERTVADVLLSNNFMEYDNYLNSPQKIKIFYTMFLMTLYRDYILGKKVK